MQRAHSGKQVRFSAHAGTIKGMESPITQPESPLEIVRRMENLVRMGTIAEVRHSAPARVRVKTGELLTDWLPWFSMRAGDCRQWWAPTAGEQCMVVSPGGDLRNGAVLLGVFSDGYPQNSDLPEEHRTTWANGDHMVHNNKTGDFTLMCRGRVDIVGTEVHINADDMFAQRLNPPQPLPATGGQ